MNPDGTGVRRLTPDLPAVSHPSWSADGQRIAFTAGSVRDSAIYAINPDGSGLTKITDHPSGNFYPTWSPDASRMAFTSNRDGDWDIYVMQTDGSGVRQLVDSPGLDDKPQWSPDGTPHRVRDHPQRPARAAGGRPGHCSAGDADPAAAERSESGVVGRRRAPGVQRGDVERLRHLGHVRERHRPALGPGQQRVGGAAAVVAGRPPAHLLLRRRRLVGRLHHRGRGRGGAGADRQPGIRRAAVLAAVPVGSIR